MTVNLINKESTMSKGTNTDKNVIHIIEHNNALADSIHNIKTSYASPRKCKKQNKYLMKPGIINAKNTENPYGLKSLNPTTIAIKANSLATVMNVTFFLALLLIVSLKKQS
jgi:hypothetical protein